MKSLNIKPVRTRRGDMNQLDIDEKMLADHNYSFRVKRMGSSGEIIRSKGALIWFYMNDFEESDENPIKKEFPILCRLVKMNARKWIIGNKELVPHRPVSLFNVEALNNAAGSYGYAVDMNACYWNIAFKYGIISKKTYDRGLPNKDPRLIALGAIKRSSSNKDYDQGVRIPGVKMETEETENAWWFILDKAYGICSRIRKLLGDDFWMWLTDCAFFPSARLSDVRHFFKSEGYDYKVEPIQIIGLVDGKLTWEKIIKDKKISLNIPANMYHGKIEKQSRVKESISP